MAAMDAARLHRVRSGARATLALGIGASLAANILASDHGVIGQIIAAWPPVALLLTVELLSRVPVGTGWLSGLRVAAAAVLALIAAWVSYWHMAEVAITYGETSTAAHLLPVSVDGLVVVASVSLVEITRRINAAQPKPARAKAPAPTLEPVKRLQDDVVLASKTQVSAPDLRAAVRALAAEHPDWKQAQLAEHLDISARTVRRHLATPPPTLTAVPTPSREAHG